MLERLAATGAAGAYAWCYGDYHPTLSSRAPFDTAVRERSFGLVRADGSEKPAAEVVRAFASRLGRSEVNFNLAPKVLDVPVDVYYAPPERHFRRLYDRWQHRRGPPACSQSRGSRRRVRLGEHWRQLSPTLPLQVID